MRTRGRAKSASYEAMYAQNDGFERPPKDLRFAIPVLRDILSPELQRKAPVNFSRADNEPLYGAYFKSPWQDIPLWPIVRQANAMRRKTKRSFRDQMTEMMRWPDYKLRSIAALSILGGPD